MNQIQQLIKKYEAERDQLEYMIKRLKEEVVTDADDQPKERRTRTRQRQENSVPTLAEKILDGAGSEGMTTSELVVVLRKAGAVINSEIPTNTVNSTLHKTAKRGTVPFVKVGPKWFLKKHAPALALAPLHVNGASAHH